MKTLFDIFCELYYQTCAQAGYVPIEMPVLVIYYNDLIQTDYTVENMVDALMLDHDFEAEQRVLEQFDQCHI